MNGSPEIDKESIFPDVSDNEWYTDAVLWANHIGVINGYSDTGCFGPADNMNREQLATRMYRYAVFMQYDVEGKGVLRIFPDFHAVNNFSNEAMKWAVGNGLITGDNGNLQHQGTVNRAGVE